MATIRKAPPWKRPDGTQVSRDGYEVRYRDSSGRQRTEAVPSMADARVRKETIEKDLRRGTWVDPESGRTLFAELAEAWLASNPAKRATTLARDKSVVDTHLLPVLGDEPVGRLKPSHIRACVNQMTARGLAPRTVRTNYGVLRAILSWAVEDDLIGRSPCRGIRLPEVPAGGKPIISVDEVVRLADEMPADYRVTVFLGTLGLRFAEMVGLRVGAVDFLRRTLTVSATVNEVDGRFVEGGGKTKASARTISVPGIVVDEIAAHLARTGRKAPGELVVQAPGGGPLRASNFRARVFDPAAARAGLDGLTFHRLRHSAGALMREAGVPLEVIQRRLGHASIRTTADVYGSLPPSLDRAAADRIDAMFASSCGVDVVGK